MGGYCVMLSSLNAFYVCSWFSFYVLLFFVHFTDIPKIAYARAHGEETKVYVEMYVGGVGRGKDQVSNGSCRIECVV